MDLSPLYRGDSREYVLTFTDSNGDPISITDWKIYFTLKKNEYDSDEDAVLKKDITEHTSPATGVTKFTIVPADTNEIAPGEYSYDIQAKKKNGDIITVVKGKLKILTDITRRTT